VIARTVVAGIEQFRRIVDEAHEGDNVGLLVRDLAADSVRAGDVLRS
jgi:translation elongation factor EF-Tu-like GTPase